MKYDAIVVGGGMAGLTAAAYLAKAGHKTALFEKENKPGGLVNSFVYKGYVFDGGIRAIEDLGIVFPMLKQLGVYVEFIKNKVSIGAEKMMVDLARKASLYAYRGMLNMLFPENEEDIGSIIAEIEKIMGYMDIQYGIENPVFKDIKNDREYLVHTLLPWLVKYIRTIGKVKKLYMPVEEHLAQFTKNQSLIDTIAQHFFAQTPAYFALSYFTLYLDYKYPRGGTGKLPEAMAGFISENGGHIFPETKIIKIDPREKTIFDSDGREYIYDCLVWAADMKMLYEITDLEKIKNASSAKKAAAHKELMRDKKGGESVFTVYAACEFEPYYFKEKHGAHVFYTPYKKGLDGIKAESLKAPDGTFTDDREIIEAWLRAYFTYTTYEISIPVLRDESLAPKDKTGLIISVLMDYSLVRHIEQMGWYEEFKTLAEEKVIEVLDQTVYPRLAQHISDRFSSTPLTVEKATGNTDGAITGWAFTNKRIPAVSNLPSIAKSVNTHIPDIYQAGQWTFSPSGLPISIITGKMAADRVIKKLSKHKNK